EKSQAYPMVLIEIQVGIALDVVGKFCRIMLLDIGVFCARSGYDVVITAFTCREKPVLVARKLNHVRAECKNYPQSTDKSLIFWMGNILDVAKECPIDRVDRADDGEWNIEVFLGGSQRKKVILPAICAIVGAIGSHGVVHRKEDNLVLIFFQKIG